jgi:hypothetical protein
MLGHGFVGMSVVNDPVERSHRPEKSIRSHSPGSR